MVHAALLLLMLEAVQPNLVSTISLKRSTQNLQLSTSSPADYPIFEDASLLYGRGVDAQGSSRQASNTSKTVSYGVTECGIGLPFWGERADTYRKANVVHFMS
jgi:hypothetical protein